MEFKSDFSVGALIDGRYEILELLGKGGMGVVYRVKQVFIGKEYAFKTIKHESEFDPLMLRRFQQEARVCFALSHPNIIAVHDFGVLHDFYPFLVMEYLDGENLSERLKRTGSLSVTECADIFAQCCLALAYAHSRNVIHRDIKPANIMIMKNCSLDSEGSVKILDLGIAKLTHVESGDIQALTRTGEIFGSPLYMSPEQCSGLVVDGRSDIYSLGCVLFESLTGTPPLIGNTALKTMMRHTSEVPPSLREASLGRIFPAQLEKLVSQMLEKNPEHRYQNLNKLALELVAIKSGGTDSSTLQAREKISSSKDAHQVANKKLLLTLVVLSILITFLTVILLSKKAERKTQAARLSPSIELSERVSGSQVGNSKSDISAPRAFALDSESTGVDGILEFCSKVTAEDINRLIRKNAGKTTLKITGAKLDKRLLQQLARTAKVKNLELTVCDLSNANLDALNEMNLIHIGLDQSIFDDAGATSLAHCKTLEDVDVSRTSISQEGLRQLCTLPNLKRLTMINCPELSDQALRELSACKKLKELDLRQTPVSNACLSSLIRTPLTWLGLSNTNVDDQGLSLLKDMTGLSVLILDDNNVSARGVGDLCVENKSIKLVNLKGCIRITNSDYLALKAKNPTVRFVKFENR